MRALWASWVALWDRREPVTAMALVRIFVGLVLLVDIANSWSVSDFVFSTTRGYAIPYQGWASELFSADPGPLLVNISFACAVCIVLGVATPVACVVYALAGAQLAYISPFTDQGVYGMLRIACVLLAFGRAGARWSIDAAVMRMIGRPLTTNVPAWPRYLLMVQLIWIYFSGGMNKTGEAWGPLGGFRAIENIATDPHLARFAPGWIASFTPFARIATAATITFELLAPAYLVAYYFADTAAEKPGRLRRAFAVLRVRSVWITLGVGFHVGIALTLTLGAFPWGMLALYPVLLRPAEIRAVAWKATHTE